MGDILLLQQKAVVHLKTAGIQALRAEMHAELIAAMHWPEKVGTTVHHWQSDIRPAFLAAAAWKNSMGFNAIPLKALLPGLMAPAQKLMEMHHTCSVGVAKANLF